MAVAFHNSPKVQIGVTVGGVVAAEGIMASGSKKAVHVMGESLWGLPIAGGALALLDLWDHHIEKERIAAQYKYEIAAMLGKSPSKIGINDMEQAAQMNPVIGEALNRSVRRRNLNVGLVAIGTIAAIALTAVFAAPLASALLGLAGMGVHSTIAIAGFHIAAHTLAHIGAACMIGAMTYLGLERPLEKFGERKLRLEEPDIDEVKRVPALQAELSVPSQITLLAQLQQKGQYISREQVMMALASADPELAEQIEARYGRSFAELPASVKTQAVNELGGQYVTDLSQDLNDRSIRAQELAFIACRQSSGVRNAAAQRRVAAFGPQLNQLYAQPRRARSSLQEPQEETTIWRQRILAERQARKTGYMGA